MELPDLGQDTKLLIIISCALVLVLILGLILILGKFMKRKYYYTYESDTILKLDDSNIGVRNIVFKPTTAVCNSISKYAISFDKKVRMLVSYKEKFNQITYFIIVYNYLHRPIKIIKVNDTKKELISKLIKLPKKTYDLNIIVSKIEGECINQLPLKKVNLFKRVFYSLLWSLICVSLQVAICSIMTLLVYDINFLESAFSLLMLYIIISSCLLGVLLFIILMFKNRKYHLRSKKKYAI